MPGTPNDTASAHAYPTFRDGTEACAHPEVDPEIFFPLQGGDNYADQRDQAVAICLACPLTQPCLLWAINTRQEHGIYGGTTPMQRRQIRRRTKGPE